MLDWKRDRNGGWIAMKWDRWLWSIDGLCGFMVQLDARRMEEEEVIKGLGSQIP